MYTAFNSDTIDELFFGDVSPPNRSHRDRFYEFDPLEEIDRDESWDSLKDPSSIGARRVSRTVPRVDQVEVKIVEATRGKPSRTSRQTALAQLREQRDVLELKGNAGLALVRRDNGEVEYTVFDPTLQNVLYRQVIGSIGARPTPQQAEYRVRQLLNNLKKESGQTFPEQKRIRAGGTQDGKISTDPGPDLLPSTKHTPPMLRRIFRNYQSRSPAVRASLNHLSQQRRRSQTTRSVSSRAKPPQRVQTRSQQARLVQGHPPQRMQRPQAARPAQVRSRSASPQQIQRARRPHRNRFDAFAAFF